MTGLGKTRKKGGNQNEKERIYFINRSEHFNYFFNSNFCFRDN